MEQNKIKSTDYLLELLRLCKILTFYKMDADGENDIKKYIRLAIDGYNRTIFIENARKRKDSKKKDKY